eukprot:TRINITY_DN4101_c0_g1_i3.p1 TRINITY_DN4101_c0_g1~~TRINITY_DN4101_c0_g1_i3.p1  ORF type:complete len:103 (-),score=4.61 TRINITY_DN4101_c0_g1_i3:523-831(-)
MYYRRVIAPHYQCFKRTVLRCRCFHHLHRFLQRGSASCVLQLRFIQLDVAKPNGAQRDAAQSDKLTSASCPLLFAYANTGISAPSYYLSNVLAWPRLSSPAF